MKYTSKLLNVHLPVEFLFQFFIQKKHWTKNVHN